MGAEHFFTGKGNGAGIRCFEACDAAQKRGLATTGGAEDGDELAGVNDEVSGMEAGVVRELALNAVDDHVGLGGRVLGRELRSHSEID